MTIALQTKVVYGPVFSRRFGKSLGINLLPSGRKLCNFDCGYCQYEDDPGSEKQVRLPSVLGVHAEAQAAFEDLAGGFAPPPDWIMISGNGEPTLHPDFPKIVEVLRAARDRYLCAVPIGILSNASTCHYPEIQDALSKLDGRFMKLDAGGDEMFRKINGASAAVSWNDIVTGLYHLPKVVIQSMFVQGAIDNTTEAAVEDWIRAIGYIRPESVQIYTVDRPPRDQSFMPAPLETLTGICRRLEKHTAVPASVYGPVPQEDEA